MIEKYASYRPFSVQVFRWRGKNPSRQFVNGWKIFLVCTIGLARTMLDIYVMKASAPKTTPRSRFYLNNVSSSDSRARKLNTFQKYELFDRLPRIFEISAIHIKIHIHARIPKPNSPPRRMKTFLEIFLCFLFSPKYAKNVWEKVFFLYLRRAARKAVLRKYPVLGIICYTVWMQNSASCPPTQCTAGDEGRNLRYNEH